MGNLISLFPRYDGDPLGLFCLPDYSFCYNRESETIFLAQETDKTGLSNEVVLDDETGFWNPNEYPLCVSRIISVKKASQFYLINPAVSDYSYKIACQDAIIGLGLIWSSPNSNQKGAIYLGDIKNTTEEQTFELSTEFPKGHLRGELMFSIVLTLKSSGNPQDNEKIYANEPGCILGVIDSYMIRIDGNGSFFPIEEVDKPGEPLWSVKCSWTDPDSEQLSETVVIQLNKAHKNFKLLDISNKTNFEPQLFMEIISNAVGIIIETLRTDGNNLTDLDKGEEGSVSLAIKYFAENLGWDINTPSQTSSSIRKYLEQKLSIL